MKVESTGKKNNTGMSTLEILIAITISILCVGTVMLVTFENQSTSLKSQNHLEAIDLAQSNVENARAQSKWDYNDVKNCEDGTSNTCAGNPTSPYTRKITIDQSSISKCAKNIKSSVNWNINDKEYNVAIMTRIADVFTAFALGGDCPSASPSGDWSNATKLNSIDTIPATLKATGIDVKNKIVYLSTDPSTATDPDFFIFDTTSVSANSKPVSTASINTGPGITNVDVAGSYAYVANDSKNGQLQIIDISNINNPILKTTFNVVPSGTDINTVGNKVFYYDKTAYLGLKKNNYAEFFAVDVSNPISPYVKGSYETNATINSITISGDYAYIGTPNNEELTIVNTDSDSWNFMQRVTGIDTPGGTGNGKSTEILGDKLYLGRTVGNIEFYVLDVSDSLHPKITGSYDLNSSINDMVVVGKYAFLITTQANSEFQILNVSDSLHPSLVKKYNYSDNATGIDYEDNLIYISSENGDALTIIQPKL